MKQAHELNRQELIMAIADIVTNYQEAIATGGLNNVTAPMRMAEIFALLDDSPFVRENDKGLSDNTSNGIVARVLCEGQEISDRANVILERMTRAFNVSESDVIDVALKDLAHNSMARLDRKFNGRI